MKKIETILKEYRQGDVYKRLNLFCQYRSCRDEFRAIEKKEGVGEMKYPGSLAELINGEKRAKHGKHRRLHRLLPKPFLEYWPALWAGEGRGFRDQMNL